MDDTSESRAAFDRLAAESALPGDRVLAALEREMVVAHPGERPARQRWMATKAGRVWSSLGLLVLALAITSSWGLQRGEVPELLTALVGGLGLCWLFLPAATPGPSRAARPWRWALVAAVAALTAGYAWITIAEFDPPAIVLAPVPWSRVVLCGLHVTLAGGLCLAALVWPWKRSDPFSPGLLGGLLGALAGYAGMLSVDASCASEEGFHVILGHASAVVLFGALGALLGRRWLSP